MNVKYIIRIVDSDSLDCPSNIYFWSAGTALRTSCLDEFLTCGVEFIIHDRSDYVAFCFENAFFGWEKINSFSSYFNYYCFILFDTHDFCISIHSSNSSTTHVPHSHRLHSRSIQKMMVILQQFQFPRKVSRGCVGEVRSRWNVH
jgi:hypothetical protein